MNKYSAKLGDIFLCDSDRFAAKIVKTLMTAPTVWQYLWRAIRKTNQEVRFYHAGLIIDDDTMIEQQGKVQYGETQKILSREIIIYRKKNLTDLQRTTLVGAAARDLGDSYGVISILGKTLTWITGLKFFEDFVHWDDTDICVNKVGKWYKETVGETFGVKSYRELTTDIIDDYCYLSPDWEVIYVNEGDL